MITIPVHIRQVNPVAEQYRVMRLLRDNLPDAATEGRFDWAYLDNPAGVASVWLAETADGEAVGTSAAFPRQFRLKSDTVRALVLSDFAIDRRFRSLGPAVALLRATLAPIDDGSFEFALDHPSASMLAVYKRLGGKELGRQTRYVRLLKVSGAANRRWRASALTTALGSVGDYVLQGFDRFRRVPGGLRFGVYLGAFNSEFGKIGSVLEERRAVCGDRGTDYLNWRYMSGIRFSNSTVTVTSGNELLAYAVLQQANTTSVTIAEFVCRADAAIEVALFHALLDICHANNVESLQASCIEGSGWCTILKQLGFAAREQSTGPVVYSPKTAKWADILTDKDQWWMTDGDRDG